MPLISQLFLHLLAISAGSNAVAGGPEFIPVPHGALHKPVGPDTVLIVDSSLGVGPTAGLNICWTVSQLLDAIPEGTRTGVVFLTAWEVAGEKRNVHVVRSLAPLPWDDKIGLRRLLVHSEARGELKLGGGLAAALQLLGDGKGPAKVVLLTAGKGADYEDAMNAAANFATLKNVDFQVLAYTDHNNTLNALEALARAGNGKFHRVCDQRGIADALRDVAEGYKKTRDERDAQFVMLCACQGEVQGFHKELAKRDHEIKTLCLLLGGCEDKLKKCEAELKKCEADLRECKQLTEKLKQQLAEKDTKILELSQLLTDKDRTIHHLHEEVRAWQWYAGILLAVVVLLVLLAAVLGVAAARSGGRAARLRREVEEVASRLKDAERDKRHLEIELPKVRAELEGARHETQRLKDDLEAEKKIVHCLKDELKEEKKEAQRLGKELATVTAECERVRTDNGQLKHKVTHLEADAGCRLKEIAELLHEKTRLQLANQQCQKDMEKRDHELEMIRKDLSQLTADRNRIAQELQDAKREQCHCQEELTKAKRQLAETHAALERVHCKEKELDQLLAACQGQLTHVRGELEKSRENLAKKELDLQRLETEKQASGNRIHVLEVEKALLHSKVEHLDRLLHCCKQESEEYQKELDRCRDQLKRDNDRYAEVLAAEAEAKSKADQLQRQLEELKTQVIYLQACLNENKTARAVAEATALGATREMAANKHCPGAPIIAPTVTAPSMPSTATPVGGVATGPPGSVGGTPGGVASTPGGVGGTPGGVASAPGGVGGTPGAVASTPGGVGGSPGGVTAAPGGVGGTPGGVGGVGGTPGASAPASSSPAAGGGAGGGGAGATTSGGAPTPSHQGHAGPGQMNF